MNPARQTLPVNYSIRNIIDSILSDNPRARKYSISKKKSNYSKLIQKINKLPELLAFLAPSHIQAYPIEGAERFARIGVLPPELVIVDERFKRMCCLPFWTVYKGSDGAVHKRFDRCAGYGWLPGCPPKSVEVTEVQKKLNEADLFIVLQTKLMAERWGVTWKFDVLRRLAREIEISLGAGSVIERYGSGPCTACAAQHCLHQQPCSSPKLKTVSLESMGICVDRICSDLALLSANSRWKINWLKHFGLPQQNPKKWKYVEALAVKLPDGL